MPIKADEQRTMVQPSNRLIREFRTDLPNPNDAAVQRFAGTIGEIGAANMKQEADQAVQAALASAPSKDADGNYITPPAPETFGTYASKQFSDAVDTRYRNNVFQDAQLSLNKIAAENQTDPERALALMTADARGRLKAIDPRFSADLEANFMREINERHRGILNLNASRDYAATIGDLQTQRTNFLTQAQDAHAKGLTDEAVRLEQEAAKITVELVKQKAESPLNLEQVKDVQNGNRFAGQILSSVNKALEEGTLTPEALADLHMISQGLGGKKEVTVGGTTYSANQVLDAIKDPRIRQIVGAKINTMRADLASGWERDTQAENARRINEYTDTTGALPRNTSSEQNAYAIETWARTNGVNPLTPEGYQILFNRYGQVPPKLYEQAFQNVEVMGTAQLEQMRKVYEQMGATITRDGTRANMTSALSAKDDAFMWWYSTLRGSNQGLNEADAQQMARRNVEKGMTRLTEESADGIIMKKMRPEKGDTFTQTNLYDTIKSSTSLDLNKMTDDARRFYLQSMAAFVAADLPTAAAMERAGAHFKANYEVNKFTLDYGLKGNGGYTPKATNPPAVLDADGNQSHEYLKPLAKYAVDQLADPNQTFKNIKVGQLELGKNLYLKQVGTDAASPSYQLYYYEPGGVQTALRTRDNTIVTIYPGRYVKEQSVYAAAALKDQAIRERDRIENMNQGGAVDALSGSMAQPDRAPAGQTGATPTDATTGLQPVDALSGAFINPQTGAADVANAKPDTRFIEPRPEHIMPPPAIKRMLERPGSDTLELRSIPKGSRRADLVDEKGNIKQASFNGSEDAATAPITRAAAYLGINENTGRETLKALFSKTIGEAVDPANTAWCAAFVNAVLRETGYQGTQSKLARSFLAYGQTPETPSQGDIVVLKRGNSQIYGHVGFFAGTEKRNGETYIKVLGGNQGGKVSIDSFPASQVLGVRRPFKLQQAMTMPGMEGTTFSELGDTA